MSFENKFELGEIVTFKTHPLLYDLHIRGDGKLVPPFMVVKEVYFEDKKKKIVDVSNGKKIAERIKYTCIFFDDNKNEFKEIVIYESMLVNYSKFFIARMDGEKPIYKEGIETKISLIEEVSKYANPKYEYGNIVYFRTKKLEILKKRISVKKEKIKGESEQKEKETIQHVVNYSTPEFVLCGYKEENVEDLFYPNGNKKKIISKELFKVKWFNAYQMKFSEQYLPMECFIDSQPFKTIVPHNSNEIKGEEE